MEEAGQKIWFPFETVAASGEEKEEQEEEEEEALLEMIRISIHRYSQQQGLVSKGWMCWSNTYIGVWKIIEFDLGTV